MDNTASLFIAAASCVLVCLIVCITNYNIMAYKLDHVVMDSHIAKETGQ